MTNNDYLKQEFEGRPDLWVIEYQSPHGWLEQDPRCGPCWSEMPTPRLRLRPVVPEGMDIPGDAYAYGPDSPGAVFIRGPIKLPEGVQGFDGWMWNHNPTQWDLYLGLRGDYSCPYLIDSSDPNAEAILAMNRPEQCEGQSKSNLVALPVMVDIDNAELREALIAQGWTPPSESDRIRLSDCELQINGGGRWLVAYDHKHFAMHLIEYGPAAVRVRRRQ